MLHAAICSLDLTQSGRIDQSGRRRCSAFERRVDLGEMCTNRQCLPPNIQDFHLIPARPLASLDTRQTPLFTFRYTEHIWDRCYETRLLNGSHHEYGLEETWSQEDIHILR